MYVDAHVHLHEDPGMKENDIIIVAVSDDLESSKKTLEIAEIPCVGVHPWQVPETPESDLRAIEKLAERASCVGEVGMDFRYVKDKERQRKFFEFFVELSREYDLPLNLHALDAWREVFEYILKRDVKRAYFHWYNGPLNLLEEIVSQGYFVGINAAVEVQKKHRRVLEAVPLKAVLTESDGPYDYRGLKLRPSKVRELYEVVARAKGVSVSTLRDQILHNLNAWLGRNFVF